MEEREERPSKGLDITRAPLPRYVNSEIEEEEMKGKRSQFTSRYLSKL